MAWQTINAPELAQSQPGSTTMLTAAVLADQLQAARAMAASFDQAELALEARAVLVSGTPTAPKGHCVVAKQFSLTSERAAIDKAVQQATSGEEVHSAPGSQDDNVLYTARVRQGGNIVVKAWAAGEISQLQSYVSDIPSQGVLWHCSTTTTDNETTRSSLLLLDRL